MQKIYEKYLIKIYQKYLPKKLTNLRKKFQFLAGDSTDISQAAAYKLS